MSQATEAKSLHEEATRSIEETRRQFLADQKAARELTARALKAHEQLSSEDLTEAERAQWTETFERCHADARAKSERAKILLKSVEQQEEMERLGAEPVHGHPHNAIGLGAADDAGDDARDDVNPDRAELETQHGNRIVLRGRARALVNRYLRPAQLGGGLAALSAQELKYLTSPRGPEQLMSPYVDRDGGAVTAEEVRNEVLGEVRDLTYIAGRARVIATNASSVVYPTVRLNVPLKKTRAGRGTGESPRVLKEIFGKLRFVPSGEGEIIRVPLELLEDTSFDVLGFLADEIRAQDVESREEKYLTGTGAGEPLGVHTAIAKLTAAGYPDLSHPHSGTGTGFKPEDIRTLPFKLRKAMRADGAAWLAHREFLEQVVLMRSEDGGAGTGQFLFQTALSADVPSTLAGYAFLESEFHPGLSGASAGDPIATFGSWQAYWIIERKSLEIKVLDQLYAETDEVGYKFSQRYDGAPVRAEAFVVMEAK